MPSILSSLLALSLMLICFRPLLTLPELLQEYSLDGSIHSLAIPNYFPNFQFQIGSLSFVHSNLLSTLTYIDMSPWKPRYMEYVNKNSHPLASHWFWPMRNSGRSWKGKHSESWLFIDLMSLIDQVALFTQLYLQILLFRVVDDKTLPPAPVSRPRGYISLIPYIRQNLLQNSFIKLL